MEINIEVCYYDELIEKDCKLIDVVCEVMKRSYVFYLYFVVGVVVLLENDIVIIGIN